VQIKSRSLAANETGAAAVIAFLGLLTIGGFFFFQYGLGYQPCPLCLEQRNAFYVSVPLAALLLLGAGYGASRKVLLLGFAVIALVMLWNAGLSAYHAGVEWGFWKGPTDCTGPVGNLGSAGDWLNVVAVRIAIVARSREVDKPATGGTTCTTTTVAPLVFDQPAGTGLPVTVTVAGDTADWTCYRYRVFESVIPLRNVAWRPS